MKKKGYYSSGELMKLAHITKKAIRYYDEHNLLTPSYVDPTTRTRFYTDDDLARLQQILLLKSLGFSLADIREITINASDSHYMADSLHLQLKLIEDRIEQLQVVAHTIKETSQLIKEEKSVDWSNMLNQIHNLGMETSMKNQYQNASNISSRINLHSLYSQNKLGWFPWFFQQCHFQNGMNVLEIGCGDGTFWVDNISRIPQNIHVVLSDISDGMLRDARRTLGTSATNFLFHVLDCESIPYNDNSFDVIIAGHVLFYSKNLQVACAEIARVLKPGGRLICSTYGQNHMFEISQLVAAFDDRIVLSSDKLYERFGKENGKQILSPFFKAVTWNQYHDSLNVTEPEPLISYILSCHGNQNQLILDRYKEFRSFVKNHLRNDFHITKDAGIFVCEK